MAMRLFKLIMTNDFPGNFFILRTVPRSSAGTVAIIVDVTARLREVNEIKMILLSAEKISSRALMRIITL